MTHNGSYQKILANDPAVLEQLIYMYSDALVRYAYCIVRNASAAEDVVEDAYAILLLKKKTFSSMEQVRAWLYKTVRSRAVDQLRRGHCVPLCDVENVLQDGDMESQFLSRERNTVVYTCMQNLPEQYRQVLLLSYFEEFSVEQIAGILGKSRKQVYNLLTRARAALKELLIREGFSNEDL